MSSRAATGHVWVQPIEAGPGLERFEQTLDRSERSRAAAFVRDADRRAYVTAHGLLRLALSWQQPSVEAPAWRFRTARFGKPELADGRLGIQFSLSHSSAHVAVVLSEKDECGIDVECMERPGEVEVLAGSVLSPGELARFLAASGPRRRRVFFRCWTLKEAYAKAVGLGLRLPFDQLDFGFGTPIELIDATRSGHPVRDWTFMHWIHGVSSCAVAFRGEPDANPTLVRHPGIDMPIPGSGQR
jgi:4'-phosphopantetheinyl transferase